jgi:23S rRNA G2445 N2-methylase RlmL
MSDKDDHPLSLDAQLTRALEEQEEWRALILESKNALWRCMSGIENKMNELEAAVTQCVQKGIAIERKYADAH